MKIGFIGLGVMGSAMCSNILKKHESEVYVYDVAKEKMEYIAGKGGIACASSAELVENSDVFITMVPRSQHVQMIFEEIKPKLRKGKIWIEMSTIDPDVSIEIGERVRDTGAEYADCPVVKSQPAAIAGKLGIFMGGEEEVFQTISPILKYMGENVIRMGKMGCGIIMKVCHNSLVHEIQNAVNETLTLAELNGINVDLFAEAVSYGGGQNFYLESKKDAIRESDWTCAFPVEYAAKDLAIGQRLGRAHGLEMPGLNVALETLNKAIEQGYGRLDNSASILTVRNSVKKGGKYDS